ncbi:hypothetical protein [Longimicrobium terrae]|uniref:Uncharacterized protein n=1 Tax=Longimicrobium terrae TaxID=1639882 RepID=A0A841GXS8_9BACT|nr:hypothetical protein [Longimicrobium terrae]MBB4636153.1 hypothetical protein [Longimicrobium terrae]MBB6070548.1 hypothetical protein [Longimicrobium terrae]NNC29534.1 hypothetical protein [Longimicrobium terrae]
MDHRAVPLEVLREFARDESERTSLRQVATMLGLGRTTLQKFIGAETTPHPRVRRKIALWYLEAGPGGDAAVPARAPSPYGSAVDTLLDGIDQARHHDARAELLDAIAALHAAHGSGPPAWLAELRGE